MRSATRRMHLRVGTALLVLLAACGGGDSPGTTESGTPTTSAATGAGAMVVESPDGTASLTIAPGSLPDGTTIDDISVRAAVTESPIEGEPIVIVALGPDGLDLSQPAELTVRLPAPVDGALVITHISGDRVELLTGDVAATDEETTATAEIHHFSWVQFNEVRGFQSRLRLREKDVEVGDTVNGDVTASPYTEPISLWVWFKRGEVNLARRITMSPPQAPISITGAVVDWDGSPTGNWDPEVSPLDMKPTGTGWEASASSRCTRANFTNSFLRLTVTANVTLIAVSEPEPTALVAFPFPGGDGEPLYSRPKVYEELLPLLDMDAGDEFPVTFNFGWAELNLCQPDGYYEDNPPPSTGSGGTEDPPGATEPGAFDKLAAKTAAVTLEVTGDDSCGNAADLADAGAELTAKATTTGGELDVRPAQGSAGLTGTFKPEGDAVTSWDDRRTVRDGNRDSQELTDIEMGDGTIRAGLTWTNHDGCTAALGLLFSGVPSDITDWFESLPPAGPSDCELVDATLEENGAAMTLQARVVDRETGEPAPDQFLVVTVFSESGGETYEAVSVDGVLTVQMQTPSGDRSSVTVNIRKDAHTLGTLFLA